MKCGTPNRPEIPEEPTKPEVQPQPNEPMSPITPQAQDDKMKSFIFFSILVLTFTLRAQVSPAPKVEAVPEPTIESDTPKTKVDGALTGAAPTDLGLIKTQKNTSIKAAK